MIFVGDISLPYKNCIKIDLPINLQQKFWFGNLEGSLVEDGDKQLSTGKVFNDFDAISQLCNEIKFVGFGLANNHILDLADIETTVSNLNKLNKSYVGAGQDLSEAQKAIILKDKDEDLVILAFGWEAINCIPAKEKKQGVNPYSKTNTLYCVQNVLKKYSDKKIICYFHWNYELEIYPQPLDRDLAKKLIDLGVYAVIGCHAHRIQGIEFYNGHFIFYGLGNFLFPHKTFRNGTLAFPNFVEKEYAVEFLGNEILLHIFRYDIENKILKHENSLDLLKANVFEGLNDFNGWDCRKYSKWLRERRYHKNKLLPIFYYNDFYWFAKLKVKYILLRHKLVLYLKYIK